MDSFELLPEFMPYQPTLLAAPWIGANPLDGKPHNIAGDAKFKDGDWQFPGSGGYVDLGSSIYIGDHEHTIIVVSRLDSFIGNYPVFLGLPTPASGNFEAFYSNAGSYVDVSMGHTGYGSRPFSLTQFGSVTGTWHSMVHTNLGGGTGKLWCNGVAIGGGSYGGVAYFDGNGAIGQQSPTYLGNPFNGAIRLIVAFKNCFPDDMAKYVSENPARIFRDPVRRVAVAAAGGSTFKAAWARNSNVMIGARA